MGAWISNLGYLIICSAIDGKVEKIIGQFNIENFLGEKLIFALDILNENLNLNKKKLYFKIKSKDFVKIEDLKIHLNVKNKYILEEFQIIDQINNCYYVK